MKNTVTDIKAIESAAKSKLNGENKLKGALASVVSQHMTGDAAPELYAMVKAVDESAHDKYAPIKEQLPMLGRAQKDAIGALYLVLTTSPAKCTKAWDAYEKARKIEAEGSKKKFRAVGVSLFGMRDAINAQANPSKLDKSKKSNGTQEKPKASPFEAFIQAGKNAESAFNKAKPNDDELEIFKANMPKLYAALIASAK